MKKSKFISIFISVLICSAFSKEMKTRSTPFLKAPVDSNVLIVDIHEFQPMIINGENYRGHDIDLWEKLCTDLDLGEFEYHFVDSFAEVMPRLDKKKADVSLGGLTITAAREKGADFIPYMRSGVGILISVQIGFFNKLWLNVKFYSNLFVKLIPFFLAWAIYICFWALIIWRLELGNPHFNDNISEGFADSRFFVHVVISSTGFGNQIPLSKWGKRVAVILMYSGIGFMFPLITGKITTEMSAKNLTYISCKEDLKNKRVAVKRGTETSKSKTLRNLGAILVPVKDVPAGVVLLKKGEVDAVVHDKPALSYVSKEDPELMVVDELFDIQIYGIALQDNSPLREKINGKVLEYGEDGGFLEELTFKWLGNNNE